jgi:hypothetical protein
MVKLMANIPKKEEEVIEEKQEEKEPLFEEEDQIEEKQEEEKEQEEEVIEEPKPKRRTRKMSPEAQEGLKKAREQSLLKRQENAKKRKEKQENEIADRISKKYINEIEELKKKILQYENTPPKEIIKEKEVIVKTPNIEETEKFSIDDLELYSEMKIKKLREMENQVKEKNREMIRNRYLMNIR